MLLTGRIGKGDRDHRVPGFGVRYLHFDIERDSFGLRIPQAIAPQGVVGRAQIRTYLGGDGEGIVAIVNKTHLRLGRIEIEESPDIPVSHLVRLAIQTTDLDVFCLYYARIGTATSGIEATQQAIVLDGEREGFTDPVVFAKTQLQVRIGTNSGEGKDDILRFQNVVGIVDQIYLDGTEQLTRRNRQDALGTLDGIVTAFASRAS